MQALFFSSIAVLITLEVILISTVQGHPLPEARHSPGVRAVGSTKVEATPPSPMTSVTYRFAVDPSGFPVSASDLAYGISGVLAESPGLLGTAFDTSSIVPMDIENPQSYEKTSMIFDEEDKQTSLSASASVTGSGYGATVSAQASYINTITTSAESSHYTLAFQQVIKDVDVDLSSLQMTDEAIQLLNSDADAFVNKWGRYFISSYTMGCNVYAYVSLVTDSETDMTKLNAELTESYNDGVFSAEGSQSYSNTVSTSSISSSTSGQATVVGVDAPSGINPNSPSSIYQLKEYVADHCTEGSIVSAQLSSFLSVPSVLDAITNSSAIEVLSANTPVVTQVDQYWSIFMQLQTLAKNVDSCAADIAQCFSPQFLYDPKTEETNMEQFYATIDGSFNALTELGNTEDGSQKIASDPSILTDYQSTTNGYSNQYTALTATLDPINFSSVVASSDNLDSVSFSPQAIEVSNGMDGVNNVYYDHNSEIVIYFHMNYGVDSDTSYIVLRADCLNGNSAISCYSLEDVQAATDSTIILDAGVCGGNSKLSATVNSTVPPNSDSTGSAYGGECPSDISTYVIDTFPNARSTEFCEWSESDAPFYVDGTAPSCEGSCGSNWSCGHTSSGNACWTGHKELCIHKNDV